MYHYASVSCHNSFHSMPHFIYFLDIRRYLASILSPQISCHTKEPTH